MKIPPFVIALLVGLSSFTQAALVAITANTGGGTFPGFDGSAITVGWSFTANDDITVTSLGFYDITPGTDLSQSHQVGLWSASGTLLASATVLTNSTLLGSFRYEGILPLQLTAGTSYVIGAALSAGVNDVYNTPASLTTDAAITLTGSARSASSAGFAAPLVLSAGNGRIGPNFQFDLTVAGGGGGAIPEPTTALFGMALVGICGLARRRNSAR